MAENAVKRWADEFPTRTGPVDHTHATFAKLGGDPVVGKSLADQGHEFLYAQRSRAAMNLADEL